MLSDLNAPHAQAGDGVHRPARRIGSKTQPNIDLALSHGSGTRLVHAPAVIVAGNLDIQQRCIEFGSYVGGNEQPFSLAAHAPVESIQKTVEAGGKRFAHYSAGERDSGQSDARHGQSLSHGVEHPAFLNFPIQQDAQHNGIRRNGIRGLDADQRRTVALRLPG